MPKLICVVLGERCNWTCGYCDRPRIQDIKDVNRSLLVKYYFKIADWAKMNSIPLHISGGETGLIPDHILDYVFSCNYPIVVETNGEFFKKGYFKKYYDEIDKVLYHCVSNLNEEIEVDIIDPKIIHLIVIHRKNIKLLKGFLRSNYKSGMNWWFQYFYAKVPGDQEEYALQPEDYVYLIKNFSTFVDKEELFSRGLYYYNEKKLNKLREQCFRKLHFVGFDLVNGRIKFCKQSHSYTAYTELNDDNFDKLINEKLINDQPMDPICQNCIEVVRYESN